MIGPNKFVMHHAYTWRNEPIHKNQFQPLINAIGVKSVTSKLSHIQMLLN